jgi:hypothetical protein
MQIAAIVSVTEKIETIGRGPLHLRYISLAGENMRRSDWAAIAAPLFVAAAVGVAPIRDWYVRSSTIDNLLVKTIPLPPPSLLPTPTEPEAGTNTDSKSPGVIIWSGHGFPGLEEIGPSPEYLSKLVDAMRRVCAPVRVERCAISQLMVDDAFKDGRVSEEEYRWLLPAGIELKPAPSPKPPAPTDDDLLAQSMATLEKGTLAYNPPDKMKDSDTVEITARIGSEKIPVQMLILGMPSTKGAKIETQSTPVTTRMKMTLKSADFTVTPLSSEEQVVTGEAPTEWNWYIKAKRSGKLKLHLTAIVEVNKASRDYTTVDREISVQVDPIEHAEDFAKTNVIWILTGLGTVSAAGLAWLKRKRKPEKNSWETPL